ncbi:unnamed protein product [Oppiella nova]|uniref:Uncharacterized protein n=1 Tax=Oppiella nova TaxID=334625 RepID=A0A7R9QYI8_9ACAR|nr:unnamed protein product [Oppiella nova]CAG2178840.1 unnamed protein product [Oppiella nova]
MLKMTLIMVFIGFIVNANREMDVRRGAMVVVVGVDVGVVSVPDVELMDRDLVGRAVDFLMVANNQGLAVKVELEFL